MALNGGKSPLKTVLQLIGAAVSRSDKNFTDMQRHGFGFSRFASLYLHFCVYLRAFGWLMGGIFHLRNSDCDNGSVFLSVAHRY